MSVIKDSISQRQQKSSSLKMQSGSCVDLIKNRRANELVIALCGAVGSGVSDIARLIGKELKTYNYHVETIKASAMIINKYTDQATEIECLDKLDRIERLQGLGNDLREMHGNDVITQFIIQELAYLRTSYAEKNNHNPEDNIKYATIIDSLKHPGEVELLSAVYGDMFYLFGVLCPEETRIDRLQKHGDKSKCQTIVDRDKSEKEKYGQKLLDTIQYSDFFINNSKLNEDSLRSSMNRLIKLLLGDKRIVPTKQEFAMFVAQASAKRSACMSRQVGAAITTKSGDIIATGRNDVPRGGGGIYSEEDKINGHDARCMYLHDHECKSDFLKQDLVLEIKKSIQCALSQTNDNDIVVDKIINSVSSLPKLKGLIEFSRAVHAEMDAITTAARLGNQPLCDSEMYVTTFPCHHCARHIVASGICKVYYIEPYEKSLASHLHGDSIAVEQPEGFDNKKVHVIPFHGVSPRRYLDLFSTEGRKNKGVLIDYDETIGMPACDKPLDTHKDYEQVVVAYIKERHSTA